MTPQLTARTRMTISSALCWLALSVALNGCAASSPAPQTCPEIPPKPSVKSTRKPSEISSDAQTTLDGLAQRQRTRRDRIKGSTAPGQTAPAAGKSAKPPAQGPEAATDTTP